MIQLCNTFGSYFAGHFCFYMFILGSSELSSTNQHLQKERRGSRIGPKEKSNYQISLRKPSVIDRELGKKH